MITVRIEETEYCSRLREEVGRLTMDDGVAAGRKLEFRGSYLTLMSKTLIRN